jgi:hypothetical protein
VGASRSPGRRERYSQIEERKGKTGVSEEKATFGSETNLETNILVCNMPMAVLLMSTNLRAFPIVIKLIEP